MSQKANIFSVKRIKKDGKLVFTTQADLLLYKEFVKGVSEGQVVEEYLEAYADTGTNLQLAKIHACIKTLSEDIGYTFAEMKLEVKRHSGLCIKLSANQEKCKSFADCSVEELTLVIQAIIEIGDTTGINFRGSLPSYQNPPSSS